MMHSHWKHEPALKVTAVQDLISEVRVLEPPHVRDVPHNVYMLHRADEKLIHSHLLKL